MGSVTRARRRPSLLTMILARQSPASEAFRSADGHSTAATRVESPSVFLKVQGLLLLAALAAPAPVLAQSGGADPQSQAPPTRAEFLQQQREAKAKALTPYEPNGLERGMDLGERVGQMLQRDGLYLKMGSLATGSGFAYGGGYRDRSLARGRGMFDAWAGASLKGYWAVSARAAYPLNQSDTLSLAGYVNRYDYPAEEFFGIGPDSDRGNLSDYQIIGTRVGSELEFRPVRAFRTGGMLEYLWPSLRGGSNDSLPDIDDIFDDVTVPALAGERDFLRARVFAEVDYRRPLNARKGGWYRVDLTRNADQQDGAFSFTRLDVDLRQFVSFLSERRVFAGRMLISTTDADAGARVPFYLMPWLGGNDTLRGFRAYRFRGPHAILVQGEYRFEIWSGLDGALFYDAGKVALRRSDLDFNNLEHDYGFGFRFNTDNGIIFRVDAAFGSRDGKHLHIVFGSIF